MTLLRRTKEAYNFRVGITQCVQGAVWCICTDSQHFISCGLPLRRSGMYLLYFIIRTCRSVDLPSHETYTKHSTGARALQPVINLVHIPKPLIITSLSMN